MSDEVAPDLVAVRALAARAAALMEGEPVPSPCISVCRMSASSGLCEGCFRTIDEIAAWSRLDDPHKRQAWALIARRIEDASSA